MSDLWDKNSLEGTVTAILEKGNIPDGYAEDPQHYTIFEFVGPDATPSKIKYPMHIDTQITGSKIRYTKKGSGCLNGKYSHIIEVLDGPLKGLKYTTGDICLPSSWKA